MDNPNKYKITSDFSSSGNDTGAVLVVNVPSHTVPVSQDREFITDVAVGSSFYGRQIRAQMQPSGAGCSIARNVPSPYISMICAVSFSGGTGDSYAFADVTRINPSTIRLRVRTSNSGAMGVPITYTAFSVTARVKTVVTN